MSTVSLPPLIGIVQPGEDVTRSFERLAKGTVAVLQKGVGMAGSDLQIVEQSDGHMKLSNRGKTSAPYMIIFMTEKQLRALLAAREVVAQIFDAAKTRKKRK